MTNGVVDLTELFKMQKVLDDDIKAKHKKNYLRYDAMFNKVYALKNEINEAWNVTNAFKMWSTKFEQPKESFLEEMVDILHFWLSVVMDFKLEKTLCKAYITESKIFRFNTAFFHMDKNVNYLIGKVEYKDAAGAKKPLVGIIDLFYKIIEFAGFTWDDVVEMYKEKNQENFNRLASGY
ncbi:dUTP diphosphatase [Bacillus pseudomycoides]|uniref:dUTPase n=1 Tax=Bacillus pseudomycoides TaxID=64104 RepID=A0A2B4MQX3_9BACI|nr:dUTP diphosphatase [Bacillus pseudomycoides]PEA80782.1 dUTPase [Bacillus pseudomycoides]PED05275.1 dUTPase [Bacillus pseudomycoides]PED70446.1 dUTPase [Bacillus pseudomycoides]PEI33541.1 dUTPase [Bacillus pseudomycoides]PEJ71205.1 dUTPase [Bacillus pseudomycoides]